MNKRVDNRVDQRARLDHAVINVRYDMDSARQRYESLGFQLTDRGYHSLGSINHLMMFDTDYLELIGLPAEPAEPGGPMPTRAGISDAPEGINGLVFKTDSADTVYEHLQRIGMDGEPPRSFTRPVLLPEGEFEARFRTVHVRPDVFTAGRVYFCEHGTPDLVWRSAWQTHANAARSVQSMVVVAGDPTALADRFGQLLHTTPASGADECKVSGDGFSVIVLAPDTYLKRYGDLASSLQGRDSIFGALTFRSANLDAVRAAATAAGAPFLDDGDRVVLRQPDFDTVLEFVPA